ncbi:MAG: threonine synthase, partial [Marivirga sp.]|nr:threonine synthase [Marivirga sp.]
YAQLKDRSKPLVFSVPSGNFGNITGGLLAKRMGLPIHKFVAATNINDVFPEYLLTKSFNPRPSRQTISNAMDVGNPSNFVRMLELFKGNFEALSNEISGYAFTDEETAGAMRAVYARSKYTMDPHGAIGYLGLKKYMGEYKEEVTGVFLETAHPAKFKEVVEEALSQTIDIPPALEKFLSRQKKVIQSSTEFKSFKDFLINRF